MDEIIRVPQRIFTLFDVAKPLKIVLKKLGEYFILSSLYEAVASRNCAMRNSITRSPWRRFAREQMRMYGWSRHHCNCVISW